MDCDDYYHDENMAEIFEELKQPKTLEELGLSYFFVRDLVLKIILTYGTVKTQRITDITGLHLDILEDVLGQMEKDGFCAQVGGSFLFSSVEYTLTKRGVEKARIVMEENPYIGMAPVPYERYFELMDKQLRNRFPIKIPPDVIERAFRDVVGLSYAKECLVESCTIGKGLFVYGAPGTGKTFIISKASDLLPPVVIPRFIEFSGRVVQIYDPDFHKPCPEEPDDPRWIKIHAPFVFTGSELSLNELETTYNMNKGVYETSPLIKANGGVLLIDDLGRQRDDHEVILNRLIVPLENRKDVIYIRGVPVIFHTHFIPAFSTNLDVSIMDEAHLRRAPLHIFLKNPPVENVVEVFRRNLDATGEDYDEDVLERIKMVYTPVAGGGEGLQPSYAHARDLAQIAQAVRINMEKERIDLEVIERALDKHVLIALQRMDIDISQVHHSVRTFRVVTPEPESAEGVLKLYGALTVALEDGGVLADFEDSISPSQLLAHLQGEGVPVGRVEVVAETKREIKKTILEYSG
ncbi:ATP-binding protein [Methanothermobacter sp.]|uniref:ATP-binding protein n=1 Tax=Methanothermobacter sp. TaxID=1884223 RepID=UPI003C76AA73